MNRPVFDAVHEFIERVSPLRLLVIGESIIDEFIPVSYEGQSMKSICPVFRREAASVSQQGGAMAVANHLRDFVAKVEMLTNHSEVIRKTRYVDVADGKKHVEINVFPEFNGPELTVDASKYDLVILADFGHGFCDRLLPPANCHVMCQTNSNNFGFNRMSKWKTIAKRSACLDLREASLQINRRLRAPSDDDVRMIREYEINSDHLFLTVGQAGSCFTDGGRVVRHPSFKTNVVDTIGSGDTFFAFAAIASHVGVEPDEILTVPSLAASLSTTWPCNERSVNRELLLEHARQY